MTLILAPLQGVTEFPFRNAFADFFPGMDEAVTPFVPCVTGTRVKPAHMKDVLRHNQHPDLQIVPQLLGNDPSAMLLMAHAFASEGYREMNWNMGCPSSTVCKRMRGCGLMPHPEKVRNILEELIPHLPLTLSIKLRLGMHHKEEVFRMVEVLNDFPLSRVMLHPRLGVWQYTGEPDLDTFGELLPLSVHPIVYNGDINDLGFFLMLKKRFPRVNSWMLGRGVLMNPFLPAQIQECPTPHLNQDKDHLQAFHDKIWEHLIATGISENRVVARMKELWSYFSKWFAEPEATWFEVSHAIDFIDMRKKTGDQFKREMKIL
jgi:tRNA-dihydrouridine synthase B